MMTGFSARIITGNTAEKEMSWASAGNDCRFLHQPEGWFSFVPADVWRKLPAERMALQ